MKPLLLLSLILFPLLVQQFYSGPDCLQLYRHDVLLTGLLSWRLPSLLVFYLPIFEIIPLNHRSVVPWEPLIDFTV